MNSTSSFDWKPFPGAQERFLASPAFEVLFGGAAGPGKTECLVMEALRQVHHPQYRAVIFRRTMTELSDANGPIERSHRWYPLLGAYWRESKKVWTFPSGAKIFFHHMEHENDRFKYQGAEYQYIGFDELTHFTKRQYLYMFSRCRTTEGTGLRCYVRAASNPGGEGHHWVKERFIDTGIANEIGWFLRKGEDDLMCTPDTINARSRSFIPATMRDNPMVTEDYKANLANMNEIEKRQLLDGDWDAEYKETVYDTWDSVHNVKADAEYDPRYPVEWWVDDGYRNPRAILLVQERPYGNLRDCLVVFDEYYVAGELPQDAIANVLERGYKAPEDVIYDPAGLGFGMQVYAAGLPATAGYNDVLKGIDGVRKYIKDSNGQRTLIVHPRCRNLIKQMGKYRWIEGSNPPKPVKEDDHTVDAVRYGIATRRMWNLS